MMQTTEMAKQFMVVVEAVAWAVISAPAVMLGRLLGH